MKQLRFYLLIKSGSDWVSTIYKDLDELLLAWKIYSGRPDIVAVIHVGVKRDAIELYNSIATNFIGKVLFTASARWVFNSYGGYAPLQAGIVNSIPIYVATEGWGYSITAASLGLEYPEASSPNKYISTDLNPLAKNWLELLFVENKPLFNTLQSYGIDSDKRYLDLEHALATDIKHMVAIYRFKALTGNKTFFDPIKIIDYYPPSLLNIDIRLMGLSVRTYNCLALLGVKCIGDLQRYDAEKLLNIQNFGKNSLANLRQCLQDTITNIPILAIPNSDTSRPSSLTASTENIEILPASFYEALMLLLSKLDEKARSILVLRMGFDCEPLTLHEVGSKFSFTRERARQIEAKAIKKLKAYTFWEAELERKLIYLIESRDDALTLLGLEVLDAWFVDITEFKFSLKFIFKNFLNERLNLINVNGRNLIARINQDEWDKITRSAISYLEKNVNKWTFDEAKSRVNDLLPLNGIELKNELWDKVYKFSHFSSGEIGERVLIGMGQSTSALIETVLSESQFPMHFKDITKRIAEKFKKNKDSRTIHNATHDVAYRFGPGTFGLLKHSPLSAKELDELRDECENIILSNAPTRQWSCTELLTIVQEGDFDYEDQINIYLLNIALSRSSNLTCLNRMIWTASSDKKLSANHRIDLAQAVETFLINSGQPMNTKEIKLFIQKERGLGDTFQIHQTQSVIRVGEGKWGLIYRDLPIDEEEQSTLVNDIEGYLRQSNKGMHITEISSILSQINVASSAIEDPTIFFTLAQRSGRMRISTGKYLFLPEWGEARRLTTSDAIKQAVSSIHPQGMKVSEVATIASKILGREVKSESIYSKFSEMGVQFDEDTSNWYLLENLEDDHEG